MSAVAKPDVLDTPVADLEIGTRLRNCLIVGNQMTTLRDVITMSEREMLRTPMLGHKSLRELVDVLAWYGLALQPEYKPTVLTPAVPPELPPTVHQRLLEIEARLDALERR